MQTYEFRINLLNDWKQWEDVRVQSEEFARWEIAVNYAKQRAYEFTAEVRINVLGSLQGHYFRAKEHTNYIKQA